MKSITILSMIMVGLTSCCGCITQPMPELRDMPDDSDCHIPLDEPVKVFTHKGK